MQFPTGKCTSENKKPDFHTEIAFSKTKKRNSRPGNALSEKKSPFPDRENHFLKQKMHFPAGKRISENKNHPFRYRNEATVCSSTPLSASNFSTNSRKAPSPPRTRVT